MKKTITIFLCLFLLITLSVVFIGCDSSEDCNSDCIHDIVIDEAVEPTCTHPGHTSGEHCSKCGEIIKATQLLPQLDHTYILDESVEPTCSSCGKSAGFHCSECGKIFVPQLDIVSIPHSKGTFIELPINEIEGISNPGCYICSVCGKEYYCTVSSEDISLPILSISGDLSGISKENKKQVLINYSDGNNSFEYYSTIKIQGATSAGFPKKNYNIQFYKDDTFAKKQKVEIVPSWGKQNKYTLKANYVDFSEARNVVSAKIYGDITKSRAIDDEISNLVNGGAIDGFPVLVFENGVYQGLYTFNTAKDDYLFGMDGDETSRQAILMGGSWTKAVALRQEMNGLYNDGWELEYSSTEDNDTIGNEWIKTSFNNMVRFINTNSGEDFTNGIEKYIDVDRAIDSMLYTWFIHAGDNTSKNMLWATYDGIKWIPSIYDLDGTWGLVWDGSLGYSSEAWIPSTGNSLWEKLVANYYDKIVLRWKELRNGPLSLSNIDRHFIDFAQSIPGYLYKCEAQKWTAVPNQKANHITQIINWTIDKLKNMDSYFGITVSEDTPYKITLITDDNSSAYVYYTSDYSIKSDLTSITYSRDGDNGYLLKKDGQVNFEIVLSDGYEIDEIVVDGSYKNLKDSSDTLKDNTFRVTKISSDLTITITTKEK